MSPRGLVAIWREKKNKNDPHPWRSDTSVDPSCCAGVETPSDNEAEERRRCGSGWTDGWFRKPLSKNNYCENTHTHTHTQENVVGWSFLWSDFPLRQADGTMMLYCFCSNESRSAATRRGVNECKRDAGTREPTFSSHHNVCTQIFESIYYHLIPFSLSSDFF